MYRILKKNGLSTGKYCNLFTGFAHAESAWIQSNWVNGTREAHQGQFSGFQSQEFLLKAFVHSVFAHPFQRLLFGWKILVISHAAKEHISQAILPLPLPCRQARSFQTA
jgi:hypothetical protein